MTTALLIKLITFPIISAITGYVTNAIAVRMLFRPRNPIRLPFFSLQGLIPKRRVQIAHSIGDTVSEHLISHEDVRRVMDDPEVIQALREMLASRVDLLLHERIRGIHPMIGMLLNDTMTEKIKGMIMAEIMQSIPAMTENLMDALEERLDFKQIVVDKIEQFDLAQFESIVLSISRTELRAIEWIGAILGLLIGLASDALLLL